MLKTWTIPVPSRAKLIDVPVLIVGPMCLEREAWLVLDTGSPVSIISTDLAELVGLDRDQSVGESRLIGPGGREEGYRVRPKEFKVMGGVIQNHELRVHDVDPALDVDGVIGLDLIGLGELRVNIPRGFASFYWTTR